MAESMILRAQLEDGRLLSVMAAHSPLSARLVEEAGFDGIWASGFELSALYGLPDMSLISMTQHLDMVRAMAMTTRLPIIADIDTGFGNAVNVDHAVRQYEAAGVAAVVIEDKTFPKVTSLVAGGRQELLPVAAFEGKIAAACHARRTDGFLIIARTEALIANLGVDEAILRARAYEKAGADLVLVHSKSRTPDEIEAFVRAWDGRVPIVLVPTTYPDLTEDRLRALGKVGICIYGNHAIRAAVAGMQQAFASVRANAGAQQANAQIASVEEIFRLQNMDRVKMIEDRFLR